MSNSYPWAAVSSKVKCLCMFDSSIQFYIFASYLCLFSSVGASSARDIAKNVNICKWESESKPIGLIFLLKSVIILLPLSTVRKGIYLRLIVKHKNKETLFPPLVGAVS